METYLNKLLSYRRNPRRATSVKILPAAAQLWENPNLKGLQLVHHLLVVCSATTSPSFTISEILPILWRRAYVHAYVTFRSPSVPIRQYAMG